MNILSNALQDQLPSGTYIISDPCYVLPEKDYDEMLEKMQNECINHININGKTLVVYNTRYGDGEFKTYNSLNSEMKLLTELIDLPVDSGLLAIIPEELTDDTKDDYDEPCYIRVEQNSNINTLWLPCGDITFGSITIVTGSKINDYNDDWFEDDVHGEFF